MKSVYLHLLPPSMPLDHAVQPPMFPGVYLTLHIFCTNCCLHIAACSSKSDFRLQFSLQKQNKMATYFLFCKNLVFSFSVCLQNSIPPSQFIISSLQHIPVYGADTQVSTAGILNEDAAEAPVFQDFMESAPENASHKKKEPQSQQAIKHQLIISTSACGGTCGNAKNSQTNSGETKQEHKKSNKSGNTFWHLSQQTQHLVPACCLFAGCLSCASHLHALVFYTLQNQLAFGQLRETGSFKILINSSR